MLIELYKNHSQWLAMAIKITKSKDLAEDLVQDMYVKMHKRGNLDGIRNVKGFVNTMLRNMFYDIKRKESKRILVDITGFKEFL